MITEQMTEAAVARLSYGSAVGLVQLQPLVQAYAGVSKHWLFLAYM